MNRKSEQNGKGITNIIRRSGRKEIKNGVGGYLEDQLEREGKARGKTHDDDINK